MIHSQFQQTPEETIYVVDIIPGVVGWIIGRAGARIKEIQAKTNCKMWVDQDVNDDQPRKLFFQGTKSAIEIAVAIIDKLLSEAPLLGGKHGDVRHLTSKILDCPAEHIGLIIGKKGSTITRIQAESGAQISINQSVEEDQAKKIIISGDKHCVNKAVALITETMRTKIQLQPIDDHASFVNIYGNSARQNLIQNLRMVGNMPVQSFNNYSDEELELINRILVTRDINPLTHHSNFSKKANYLRRADSDLTSTESADSMSSMSHFRAVDSTRKAFPHGAASHNSNFDYRKNGMQSNVSQYTPQFHHRGQSNITAEDYHEWMLMRQENKYNDASLASTLSVNKNFSHVQSIVPSSTSIHHQQLGAGGDMTSPYLGSGMSGSGSTYQSLPTFRNDASRQPTANQSNFNRNPKKHGFDDVDSFDMFLANTTHSLSNTTISHPVNYSYSNTTSHHQVQISPPLQQEQSSYKSAPQQMQVHQQQQQISSTNIDDNEIAVSAAVGSYSHCVKNNIMDGSNLFQYCV